MSVKGIALVLNASYELVNVVSARSTIKLVMKCAACVELASLHVIRTVLGGIPAPSVVRLLVYRKVPLLNRSVRKADRTHARSGYAAHSEAGADWNPRKTPTADRR